MRLYYYPWSMNARRAVMTALHLNLPVELVAIDLAKGEQRTPEFRALNPNGRVPVLVDGDFKLWESHAIMQYLADKTPGQTVYPSDLRGRADVNRWLFWSAQHFTPAVSVLNWERAIKPMLGAGAPDPVEVARGERLIGECAPVLDAHLAGREWVAGPKLTLADIALATPLMATQHAQLPVAQYTNLQSWFARVQALDAWKRTAG